MQQTKIALSPKELELVTDAGFILTKNGIIEKVYALFGILSETYRQQLQQYPQVAADTGLRSPKISKGEQYEGLPWVMLDHPRHYSGNDAFGIRSFFWWGNFCSINLQLSGIYQDKYARAIQQMKNRDGWMICTGADPWQHHLRQEEFQPYAQWKGELNALPFIKLAKKIPLQEWERLEIFFETGYQTILDTLAGEQP